MAVRQAGLRLTVLMGESPWCCPEDRSAGNVELAWSIGAQAASLLREYPQLNNACMRQ
jgi:hypothetical protein